MLSVLNFESNRAATPVKMAKSPQLFIKREQAISKPLQSVKLTSIS